MPTTYMNLTLPTVSVTAGPTYATENNQAFTDIDAHDHTTGKGTKVPSAGLNINADLSFGGYNLTTLKSTRYSSQGSPLAGGSDLNCVYVSAGNLYFNNSSGTQIQLTNGNAFNASLAGGFTSLAGTGAAATYTTGLFTFTKTTSQAASIDAGSVTVREPGVTSAHGITIKSPASLSADYNLQLPSALGSANQALVMNSNGTGLTWRSGGSLAPTIQKFTSTGTTTGYLFTISTSSTVAAGDTYTNNSQTFTVLAALSAQSGQVLFTTATGAPAASGNLARATGSGTATIAFTSSVALATYTTAANTLYLRVRMIGGGGGGGSSGTASWGSPSAGGTTVFGASLLVANGGAGGVTGSASGFNSGGTASLGTGPIGIAITGASGSAGSTTGATGGLTVPGGVGGVSPFGGGGATGGYNFYTGQAAIANTGSGGGGAGVPGTANDISGGGGCAGGFIDAIIASPAATYVYCVGSGGSGGTAGTSGYVGGNGASGIIEVTEYYS